MRRDRLELLIIQHDTRLYALKMFYMIFDSFQGVLPGLSGTCTIGGVGG